MEGIKTLEKFTLVERQEDMTSMHDNWNPLWNCECSLYHEHTWDNPRYDIGLNWASNPVKVEATPEQDLAFKELLKRVKAWEDEKQMTFKGSLISLCRNYMLSRPLACPLCGQ